MLDKQTLGGKKVMLSDDITEIKFNGDTETRSKEALQTYSEVFNNGGKLEVKDFLLISGENSYLSNPKSTFFVKIFKNTII